MSEYIPAPLKLPPGSLVELFDFDQSEAGVVETHSMTLAQVLFTHGYNYLLSTFRKYSRIRVRAGVQLQALNPIVNQTWSFEIADNANVIFWTPQDQMVLQVFNQNYLGILIIEGELPLSDIDFNQAGGLLTLIMKAGTANDANTTATLLFFKVDGIV